MDLRRRCNSPSEVGSRNDGEDFENTKINIWVHIYGLPFELRSETHAKGIAKYVGELKLAGGGKGSPKNSVSGDEYVRFRVELDVSKPIVPGMFLRREGRKPTWVYMKYVKLPNACYKCGLLTHETRTCKQLNMVGEKMYGSWLRVEEQAVFSPKWTEEMEGRQLVVSPIRESGSRQSDKKTVELPRGSGNVNRHSMLAWQELEVPDGRLGVRYKGVEDPMFDNALNKSEEELGRNIGKISELIVRPISVTNEFDEKKDGRNKNREDAMGPVRLRPSGVKRPRRPVEMGIVEGGRKKKKQVDRVGELMSGSMIEEENFEDGWTEIEVMDFTRCVGTVEDWAKPTQFENSQTW